MAKFAPHMGDPQTSPQHADPHGLRAFLKKTIQEIHVDQRVVGWSVGRHVDHPCGSPMWITHVGGGKFRLAHQNRTIAIASDFRVDGAKSPEFLQKEWVLGLEIAARNRKSLATFHRTFKSQCSIALHCLRHRSRFLGSAMGIAIANRKNRCDLGALRNFAMAC